MSDKNWLRNPRHRKYKPGEEDADVRNEKETDGEEEASGQEDERSEKGDG